MVFLLRVGRLPLATSRIISRNRILCEAAFTLRSNVTSIPRTIFTLYQWRSKGDGWGPRAALSGRQHFADQKLIFERSLKVLVFRYYFIYIFYRFSIFMFKSSRLVG